MSPAVIAAFDALASDLHEALTESDRAALLATPLGRRLEARTIRA